MKFLKIFLTILFCIALISCSEKLYKTNGEKIYKTGKNLQGDKMINRSASRIPFVRSCVTCHGKNGNAMKRVSVQFSYLSNPNNFTHPYTDSLFFRFLDHDLKSDSTKANIGVIFKMSDNDKKDLLAYLKTL
ncbi:MAG: hypothetical protein ABIN94_08715 [Ferruginibacter sp.]